MPDIFESSMELEEEGWGKWVKRGLRSLLLVLVCILLVLGKHPGWDQSGVTGVLLRLLGILVLLVFLFFFEALEIAYSLLRDRNRDEFPDRAKILIDDMKARERFVYGAREWLVTLIVVAITTLLEYDPHWIPFYGAPSKAFEPAWHFIALILTALPILWLAQGPGKAWAKAAPLQALTFFMTRACWKLVTWVGTLIERLWLDLPEKTVGKLTSYLARSGSQLQLRPSNEGFFIAGLQRYGMAIHKISVTISIGKNGCHIHQKIVWFLLRYTGREFSRKLYLEGKPKEPALPKVLACTCPTINKSNEYEKLSGFLDQLSTDAAAVRALTEFDRKYFTVLDNACVPHVAKPVSDGKYTSLRFTAHNLQDYPLKPKESSFTLCVEHECEWDKSAFKTGAGESDSFEMSFEYPCRRYELKIQPDPGIILDEIVPTAEFMSKPHGDETRRLIEAYRQSLQDNADPNLCSALDYALPGAKYKYSWKILLAPTDTPHAPSPVGTVENPLVRYLSSGRQLLPQPTGPAPGPAVPAAPVAHPATVAPVAQPTASAPFDVFLCHNSADKPAVIKIAQLLKQKGIRPWLDIWELRPGLPWQRLLEEQIQNIRTAAVFVGASGIAPWQENEMRGFLEEFNNRRAPVIPVLLPDCPHKPDIPIFLKQMTWVDFRSSQPDPLEQLIWGITGKKAHE